MPNPYIHGNAHSLMGADPMTWPGGDPTQGISFVDYFLESSGTGIWSLITSGGTVHQYPDVPILPADKANGIWTMNAITSGSGAMIVAGQATTSPINGLILGLGNFVMKLRCKITTPYAAPTGPDFFFGLGDTNLASSVAGPYGLFFGFGSNLHANANGSAWYAGVGPNAGVAYSDTSASVGSEDGFIWLELDVSADGKTVTWKVNNQQIYQITNNTWVGTGAPFIDVQRNASAPTGSSMTALLDTFALSYSFLS